MTDILLIIFTITILFMSIANRIYTYINALIIQGILLFVTALYSLSDFNTINLVFILLETVVVKALVLPLFIKHIIKRNGITRETEPFVSNFVSLLIVTGILVATLIIANAIEDSYLDKTYFVVALVTLFTGLYMTISRKKIISHVIAYLLIENGVFILALAVGNEMPMLLNMGVLLDVFASVLILGIFFNKIGDVLKDPDVELLQNLKDK